MSEKIIRTERFTSSVNSFAYLNKDATHFLNLSVGAKGFERIRYARSSVLLSALCVEALVHRAWVMLAKDEMREWYDSAIGKKERKSLRVLLVELPRKLGTGVFDLNSEVGREVLELIQIRHDYVHPKDRQGSYSLKAEVIDGKETLIEFDEDPSNPNYARTGIPRDPFQVMPSHAARAKAIVDCFLNEFDKTLSGSLLINGLIYSDFMNSIESLDDHIG